MSDSRQQLRQGVLTVPNAVASSVAAMLPVLAVALNAPAAVPAAQTFDDVTFMRPIDIARSFAQQVAKP